ncbi:glycoside hydrolase family 16 protein [Mycena rosella]|uniref:Glycoside hydrolase family 16 protein n=1 Tax=Mycena rosella TaxID=1033263 RepID=A0AAD7D1G9_MYCRO|nr:glycoside hydrolase family 16 protein [Mycena rosella]
MRVLATSLLGLSLFLATASASIPELAGYNVVWSDDFNGNHGAGVDHTKWAQVVGPGNAGNREVEVYTAGTSNVHLSGDGQLYIVPTLDSGTWHSGRLEGNVAEACSPGGAMVFQAELWVPDFTGSPAKFLGLWPAFWALGNDLRTSGVPWPKCGEWDIFETADWASDQNHGTLHYEDANGNHVDMGSPGVMYATGQYHTWAFKVDLRNSDWTQQKLIWYLDGTQYYQITGAMIGTYQQWVQVAMNDFYPVLNMAVGGDYPKFPTSQTVSGFDSSLRVKVVLEVGDSEERNPSNGLSVNKAGCKGEMRQNHRVDAK